MCKLVTIALLTQVSIRHGETKCKGICATLPAPNMRLQDSAPVSRNTSFRTKNRFQKYSLPSIIVHNIDYFIWSVK